MREIGMEKLIELLNEYAPAEENCRYEIYDKYVMLEHQKPEIWYVNETYGEGDCWDNQTLYFISKKGGFIKWLVENNKIDRDKCGFKNEGLSGNWYDSGIAFVQNYDNDTFKISEFYSPYLQLLMLLSISDTPIEDLISYLK